jgi:hypothetical protein
MTAKDDKFIATEIIFTINVCCIESYLCWLF